MKDKWRLDTVCSKCGSWTADICSDIGPEILRNWDFKNPAFHKNQPGVTSIPRLEWERQVAREIAAIRAIRSCPNCHGPLVILKEAEGKVVLGCMQECGYMESLPPHSARWFAEARPRCPPPQEAKP